MAFLSCAPNCADPEHWTLQGERPNVSTDWILNGGCWTATTVNTITTTRCHKGLTSAAALAMIAGNVNRRLQRDGGNGYSVIEEITA